MSDRLHDTLTSLRSDTDRAPLADSIAVRARGNQRTRRQAVGTSLAVVAVVAGVIGVSGALTGTNKAENLPADPTTSQTPAPAPTDEARPAIDISVLIAAADLPPVPAQTFAVGETLDPATSADTEERSLTACGAAPNGDVRPDKALLRTFPSDLDAFAYEWVAQYPTDADALRAFGKLSATCPSAGATVTTAAGMNGFVASRFSSDPGSEFNGDITAVAQVDNTVVVVGLRAMVRESEIDLAEVERTLNTAAMRVAAR